MKKSAYSISFFLLLNIPSYAFASSPSTAGVDALLNRLGGKGTANKINTRLIPSDNSEVETFTIKAEDGKPTVEATSLSALTSGLNWYLTHGTKQNAGWTSMKIDDSQLTLPEDTLTLTSNIPLRYYLNYCTFSYSMSPWTWQRWEKEIDWMALHGINMPLQIVGLDVVWRKLLTEDYGYTKEEADNFIAGPCFQAWWGMNNLEGWGGPNPDWWYIRQEQLAKKINSRMRELGMQPVLPGFCGMVPQDFTHKTGIQSIPQGDWCGFRRPDLLNPESPEFAEVAANYYKRLSEVMGESEFYSMDPFHEGANTSGVKDIGRAYGAIYEVMDKAVPGSKWVIQQWQWSPQQFKVLDNVPEGRLIVLDLFSDGRPRLGEYKGHDVVYCVIPNFGGRTGTFGRMELMNDGWFAALDSIKHLRGIGAAPEAIEQSEVVYDFLYEMPWMVSKPDFEDWIEDYSVSRYGMDDPSARKAWRLLGKSVLNCPKPLQGPHEAVLCARPDWNVRSVSTWGSSELFYDTDLVVEAARLLLEVPGKHPNLMHDITDITRQALTDKAHGMLSRMSEIHEDGGEEFESLKTQFLMMFDDLDELLSTRPEFMIGTMTGMARKIPSEVTGTTLADRDWLEYDNARTLVTTWGLRKNSEDGGLRDYSYREWAGLLRDYYKPRWEAFFNGEDVDWYDMDRAWIEMPVTYHRQDPSGDTREVAKKLLNKYFPD